MTLELGTASVLRFRLARDEVRFPVKSLVIAAFTGRDREQVRRHIRELEEIGVRAPDRVPDFYLLPTTLLTTDQLIEVEGEQTSGEAEPVLFLGADRWYVGVGSDHTARDLERESIPAAKRACPKVVGRELLSYEDVVAGWDRLSLRSWVEVDGERIPYQEGSLAELLPVPKVLEELAEAVEVQREGMVVFLGTIPLLGGSFVPADTFTAEIASPDGEVRIACSYRVRRTER